MEGGFGLSGSWREFGFYRSLIICAILIYSTSINFIWIRLFVATIPICLPIWIWHAVSAMWMMPVSMFQWSGCIVRIKSECCHLIPGGPLHRVSQWAIWLVKTVHSCVWVRWLWDIHFRNAGWAAWESRVCVCILSGSNLFTLTGYSGYDPEVNIQKGLTPGIDNNVTPRSRVYAASEWIWIFNTIELNHEKILYSSYYIDDIAHLVKITWM